MDNIYSVTQINNYIKGLFVKDSVLKYVSVRGEISNCKYHSSGHIYFTVKDGSAQLACVMFAGKRSGLDFRLEEGISVIVTGSINIYERDGKYQLYAEHIEQEGKGVLYERFEKLRAKLLAEGLFDPEHKKPIPRYIKTLGIITAETGAALQDILNISGRRNPYIKRILYPARVQGEGAAKTLIAGIHAMERIAPDVIIIGRGGGSIEDLFEFNDEELARAIYDCPIPVISAVGHEVDFTICDYVSDLRAPTPSAAAELAVYEYAQLNALFVDYHSALCDTMLRKIQNARVYTERYGLRLNNLSPASRLNTYRMRLASAEDSIEHTFTNRLRDRKHSLQMFASRLDLLSPLKRLEQGYSYVTDSAGHNLKSTIDVNNGDHIRIRMLDGSLDAEVTGKDVVTDGR